MTRIVCISDTHNRHEQITVPDGDILVHAGDATGLGEMREFVPFLNWLDGQPHAHKVLIAGNHDWCFERWPVMMMQLLRERRSITYLQDEETVLAGLRFWGSPWQPEFGSWAFGLPRDGLELERRWARIPSGLDVLVTHGPAHGMLDRVGASADTRAGCKRLRDAIDRAAPRLHVCGHIHQGRGKGTNGVTESVNAAICTGGYESTNAPIVVDVSVDGVEVSL